MLQPIRKNLTPRQKKLYDILVHNEQTSGGVGLSFDEMAQKMKLLSRSTVYALVNQLIERGYATKEKNRGRSVRPL